MISEKEQRRRKCADGEHEAVDLVTCQTTSGELVHGYLAGGTTHQKRISRHEASRALCEVFATEALFFSVNLRR